MAACITFPPRGGLQTTSSDTLSCSTARSTSLSTALSDRTSDKHFSRTLRNLELSVKAEVGAQPFQCQCRDQQRVAVTRLPVQLLPPFSQENVTVSIVSVLYKCKLGTK